MKTITRLKNCLLIVPTSFYSYSEYLKKGLTSFGYSVTVMNDEYPSNIIGKIMGKLRIPLLLRTTKNFIVNCISNKEFELVLIIKGRGMSLELIADLRLISTKVIGYNYDSFSNHNSPLKWFNFLSKYYTFDYKDSEKYSIPVVELFSSLPQISGPKTCDYDLSAILRNHSNRLKNLDKILVNFISARIFIYIYEQNFITLLFNALRSPLLYFKYRKKIHFRSLPYDKYIQIISKSNFTLDIVHPGQSGITIRCFEALSSQTKIITNNPFVLRNKHFNSGNTIVVEKALDTNSLRKHFTLIKNHLPPKYIRTVENFLQDLIR